MSTNNILSTWLCPFCYDEDDSIERLFRIHRQHFASPGYNVFWDKLRQKYKLASFRDRNYFVRVLFNSKDKNDIEIDVWNHAGEYILRPMGTYITIAKLKKEWKLPGIDSFETELMEFLDAYLNVK